jgi:hypothetical protein
MDADLHAIRPDSRLKTGLITVEGFQSLTHGKSIYILSVNLEGTGLAKRLKCMGFNVDGFVDSRFNGKILGIPVFGIDEYFGLNEHNGNVLIVATKDRVWKKKSFERAESLGYVRGENLFSPLDLCPFFPTIEVSGKCNLTCKTCDMGLPGANDGRGHMSAHEYEKNLVKLLSEVPFLNSVALYTWGEPLLNPDIAEIIRISNRHSVTTEVSSNLEFHKYLDDFVLAEPGQIVAPCAGVGERYERGRTGGTWKNYLKGITRISELKLKHGLNISLRIMYHMYNDNIDHDYDEIVSIGNDLGFEVIPILAHLFPGQVLHYALSGRPIPQSMRDAEQHLLYGLDEQLKFAVERKDKPCHIIQAFPTISWDGRLLHCCNMQAPYVGSNAKYLDMPLGEFIAIRNESAFCTKCMNAGVHRFFDVNIKLVETAQGRTVVRL